MSSVNHGLVIPQVAHLAELDHVDVFSWKHQLATEFSGDVKAQHFSGGETIAYSNYFDFSMTPIAPTIAQSSTVESYWASNQALQQQPARPAATPKGTPGHTIESPEA